MRHIYFDNATTSFPKPKEVCEVVSKVLRTTGGSAGRGGHKMLHAVEKLLYTTRESIADLFLIPESKNIVFTQNATEAINIVLKGLLKKGDNVIVTSLEHNAIIRPLCGLEKKGVTYTVVSCSPSGELDSSAIEEAILPNTRLIAMTHASNVIGTITPVKRIGEIAKKNNILFLVDAAQTAGSIPVDAAAFHIDFLACTGHKGLLGPQGTGFLYVRESDLLDPFIEGGTGSSSESFAQPVVMPDKLQSGTLNTPGIAGLGAALTFIRQEGLGKIREHLRKIAQSLLSGLQTVDTVTLYGCNDPSRMTAVVSFAIEGKDPAFVAARLEEKYGIVTRVGLHCAPLVHKTMGTFPQGTVRLSPGFFNSSDEAEYVIDAIRKIARE